MNSAHIDLDELARSLEGGEHSIFGASGSGMFLNCPGSLIPNLLAPDKLNKESAYGTVAHRVGEIWRASGEEPVYLLGTNAWVEDVNAAHLVDIDEAMFALVEQCVNLGFATPGHTQLIESRVDYSDLTPIANQGGTLDFASIDADHALVQDDKYGKAETIAAQDNSQLMLYAYGLLRKYPTLRRFTLRIAQPRLGNFDDWEVSAAELRAWANDYAKPRMREAWKIDAQRIPGAKQCRYCRVQPTCGAHAVWQERMFSSVFEADAPVTREHVVAFKRRLEDDGFAVAVADPATLETQHLVSLFLFKGVAESFWKNVALELGKRYARDRSIPGIKAVAGRSNRVFRSESSIANLLRLFDVPTDSIFTTTVVKPAQAERLLMKHGLLRRKDLKNLLDPLVVRPTGKATLVPLSDKRAALFDVSEAAFADDDDNPETEELA